MEFNTLLDQIASLTPERRDELRALLEGLECVSAQKTLDDRLLLRREPPNPLCKEPDFEVNITDLGKRLRKGYHRHSTNTNAGRPR